MANGLKCKTCGEELHPADGAAMCKCRVCGTIQLVPAGDAKEQAKPEQQKAVRERPDERIEPEKTGRKEDSRHPVQQREYAHRKHAGKKSKPHPEDGIRKIKTFTSYTEAGREAENRLQVQSGERTGTQEEGQRPAGAGHRPETVEAWRKDKRQEERRKKIGRIVPALSVIAVLAVCGYLVVTNLLQPENESNREQIAVSGIMPAETNAAAAAATPAPEERQPTEQEINYSKAEEYLAEGDLFEARKYYQLAEGFSDAVQKAKDIDAYIQAETKNSEKAAEDTNPDESHEEDPDAAKETEYLAALELIMKGERLEAETILEGLSGWKNADEKLEQLREDIADLAAQAGDYDTAIAYYNKLENRTDAIIAKLISANKGKNYRDGMAALASGDLDTANAKLIAAEGFQDAADQLNKLNTYRKANAALAESRYREARADYLQLGEYLDAAEHLETCNAALYREAAERKENGDNTGAYELFSLISGYSDSGDIAAQMDADYEAASDHIENGELVEAESLLAGLTGWKDVDGKLEQLREDIADQAAEAEDYDTAIAYYNKLNNKTEAIEEKIITATRGKNYREAMAALASGDLDTAEAKLIAAENFRDAAEQLDKLNTYRKAGNALAEGRYREARVDYLQLEEYLDAAAHLETCNAALYREAAGLKASGDNTGAYELFSLISGYSDSGDIAAQMDADYEAASAHIENGELVEAEPLLAGLTGWKDVDGKLEQLREDVADRAAEAEDYDTAITYYNKLNNRTEAIEEKLSTSIRGKNYQEAMAALETGDLETANAKLIAAEGFRDAADQLNMLNTYRKAGNALAEGRYREARTDFMRLGKYLDSETHLETCNAALYREAAGLKANGDNAGAYELFSLISGYSDSGDIAAQMDADYEAASAHIENGELVEAEPLLAGLTGWKDVDGKLEQLREDIADRAAEAGDYDTAIAYYNKLSSKTEAIAEKLSVAVKAKNYREGMAALASGDLDTANTKLTLAEDYLDAADQLSRLTAYQEAAALKSSGAFDEAVLVYTSLGEYLDSAEQVNACLYGKAAALKSSGAFDEAVLVYTGLGEYLDSAEQVSACLYGKAEALLRNGMYEEAASAFEALGDYADAARQVTEARYRYAKSLYDAGDYTAAYAAYKNVKGYQDTDELLATDENLVKVKLALYTTAGNIVTFGSYEQDNDLTNGPEKIEWIVLESRNGKVLLLSRYGLDAKPYDTKKTKITWEKCSLRAWLNDEFFRAAFSAEEQDAIVTANVSNSQSQGYWRSNGGNDTQDRVFLLSYAEARQYLGVTYKNTQNERSRTSPTAYAIAQGAETSSTVQTDDGQPVGIWWLRSPGLNEQSAAHVHNGGSLYYRAAGSASVMVRPVIMLDLASVQ